MNAPSLSPAGFSLLHTYGAAFLSAGAWGLALGYGVWPLAWGAFVPLWAAWMHRPCSPSQVLTHTVGPALLAYGGAFLLAYPWVLGHATRAGTQAGLSALLLLSALYSLPLMAGGRFAVRGQLAAGLAVWGGGWLLVDLLLQRGPWAFPWALGAHALVDSPGTAFWVRAVGPSAAPVCIGAAHAVMLCLLRVARPRMAGGMARGTQWGGCGGAAAVVLGGLGLIGGLSLLHPASHAEVAASPASRPASSKAAPVVWAVQPHLSPTAWSHAANADRARQLHALTSAALDSAAVRPDLVVWPETALHPPDTLGLQARVRRWGVAVLTGAVLPAPRGAPAVTNSALLYRPDAPVQRYDKRHLVPFAEAVPGASWWGALRRLTMPSSSARRYIRGSGPARFVHPTLPLVPLICFESLAAPLPAARPPDRSTAHGLVTIAQTGWWERALPARQHVRYSRLRALETGQPLLVASVSGPVTLVAPSGAATALTDFGERTVARMRWPASRAPGRYVRTAPYTDIAWTAIGLLLVCIPVFRTSFR